MITISIARDFTRFPAGRYRRNGSTSGEAFRQRFLEDPLRRGEPVTVEFDGTVGYGSSFLEEAFGGVVRALGEPPERILSLLTFQTSDPSLRDEVRQYIEEAGKAMR